MDDINMEWGERGGCGCLELRDVFVGTSEYLHSTHASQLVCTLVFPTE
jgi:hypothetical protein